MKLQLSHSEKNLKGSFQITGSKSESNRVLILQALYPQLKLQNLSDSDDSRVMQEALQKGSGTIDIHHAGTAMRFLTAYFALKEGNEVVLTGSDRMKERPVKLLVEALNRLGSNITYLEKEGFPPIKITGKNIVENKVRVKANISSQYISALMLIAPSLPKGLEIILEGQVTSEPYIKMTLELLQIVGIEGKFEKNNIRIQPKHSLEPKIINIESDWSSASYFYSLAAISESSEIRLSNYRNSSLQGDSCIQRIYQHFGVKTYFEGDSVVIKKIPGEKPKRIVENLQDSPDIAQTLAVTCLALGVECELAGLHTLKIKETDRLVALKNEMEKFGARVKITEDHLHLFPAKELKSIIAVETYNDHRMAMAFAPLALKVPLEIKDAGVVSKSYPTFWQDMESLGFSVLKPL